MGKLVVSEFISLDGVVGEPAWTFDFNRGDEGDQFKGEELRAADAQLLGRVTYQGFAKAWPTMPDAGWFGEKMNTMPKYVVSSTLDKVDWSGSKLIHGNVAQEIRKLKQMPGKDLLLSGSAQLFNSLMQENLIDLYRFMLHPIVLGKGRRLFAEGIDSRTLELTDTKTFATGIMILELTPAGS